MKRIVAYLLITLLALALMGCGQKPETPPPAAVPAPETATAAPVTVTVDPAARGRGCGTRLLTELLRRLAAEGVAAVYLEVRTQNAPAIALYEKTGFVRTGLRKRFYCNPPDDAITMKKENPLQEKEQV